MRSCCRAASPRRSRRSTPTRRSVRSAAASSCRTAPCRRPAPSSGATAPVPAMPAARIPTTPDVMFQRDVDYCSGAFLLTPSALFHELGGFDERFAPAYYEEADYCVRLWKRGYRVVYDPDAAIIHYEFGSSAQSGDALRQQAANHAIFVGQHRDWLARQFPASPLNLLAARAARSTSPGSSCSRTGCRRWSWAGLPARQPAAARAGGGRRAGHVLSDVPLRGGLARGPSRRWTSGSKC